MDDITFQNQANIKVPKDAVQKFASDQNKVEIIKSEKLTPKPFPETHEEKIDTLGNQIKSDNLGLIQNQQTTVSQATKQSPNAPSQDIPQVPAQLNIKSLIVNIIKYLLIIIVALVCGYVIVNWPALILKFNFWQNSQNWTETHPIILKEAKNTPQKLDENYLYIESLGIYAPVTWGVKDSDLKEMFNQGLVNYEAGALPDDAVGEIYLAGQTSGVIWSSSTYKTVFTLLNNIKKDAKIMLVYKNKIYTYQVENYFSKFGSIDVTPGYPTTSYLKLIAKYPIGIGWSTFIVESKLLNIDDNVSASIEDKTKDFNNSSELEPEKIIPTEPTTLVPITTTPFDDSTAPQVFLPEL